MQPPKRVGGGAMMRGRKPPNKKNVAEVCDTYRGVTKVSCCRSAEKRLFVLSEALVFRIGRHDISHLLNKAHRVNKSGRTAVPLLS
jgi:hypothetical protein